MKLKCYAALFAFTVPFTSYAGPSSIAKLKLVGGYSVFELYTEPAALTECKGTNMSAVIAKLENNNGKQTGYGTGCWTADASGYIHFTIKSFDDGIIRTKVIHKSKLSFESHQPTPNDKASSNWEFQNHKTVRGTPVCSIFAGDPDKSNVRNVSVKQLANRDSLNVTLYNDKWTFNRAASINVVMDFGDNQPLKLAAFGDGKVLDVSLPKEVTSTFLLLMRDQKQLQFKPESSKEKLWSVPLQNMAEPLKQFVDCAFDQKL